VHPGRLFYIMDNSSNHCYLVMNTGNALSIPWTSESTPSEPSLAGADGRRIPC
jgi:hypothetical protein